MEAPLLSLQDEEVSFERVSYSSPAWHKYWVLFLYGTLSALQSLLWISFSSVPAASREFLHTDDETLTLFLDWGPVAFCISVFPAQWFLSRKRSGLRDSIRLGFLLCLLASLLRCYPALLSSTQRQEQRSLSLALVHIAQFINGAVAPLAVASPSYLSLIWFPENQRNSATAIANVSNAVGRAVGFFLGPALVAQAGDVSTLLYVCLACAALPCAASFLFLPPHPPDPPSSAAAREAESWINVDEGVRPSPPQLLSTVSRSMVLFLHPPFAAAAVSGGITMALYGAWSGELTPALTQGGYSANEAGAIGSTATFAGIAGGVIAGWVTDLPALRRHLKSTLLALSLGSAIFFLPLAFALPPLSQKLPPAASSWLSFPTLLCMCGLGGLLRGGMDPLYFELAAETAWDSASRGGPDTAGTLLTLLYHLILTAALSIPSGALMAIVLPSMPVALLVGVFLLLPLRVKYDRRK